jgi:photosynthetic reaction center cytochrome c subunit
MKILSGVFVLVVLVCGVTVCYHTFASASEQQSMSLAPQPAATATPTAHENPNQEINDRFVKALSGKIAGRENEPAAKVFKNIQIEWLKNEPAERFLDIMNFGYSRALGVACTHCHGEQDFSSDDKRPKRAAREMAVMHKMINNQLLKMQNLESKSERRFINCRTCHRGAINPKANP